MQSPGSVVSNPADQREMRANANGGRLGSVSATGLEFNRYSGELIEIRERLMSIPVTGLALSNATTLIDIDGTDTFLPPGASTFYHVYLSNDQAGFPFELRLSASPPTDSAVSGQKYLDTSGDGANWRLVGYLQTDAAGQFVDSETQRFVINEDNRIPLRLRARPAYNDNNAQTTVARTTATFAALNSGTGDSVSWCDNGRDIAALLCATFSVLSTPAAVTHWGLGVDSATNASACAVVAAGAANVSVSVAVEVPPASAAARTVNMVCATGAGATWIADVGRVGSAADVPATFLDGWVLG